MGHYAQPTVTIGSLMQCFHVMRLQPVSILVPTLGMLPLWQARADAWYNKTGIKVVREQALLSGPLQ